MNVKEKRVHVSPRYKEDGCTISTFYVCGECGTRFHWWEKGQAEDCCVYDTLHDFGDPQPTCLCGQRATGADVKDSKLLGTLVRCRACILKVAPEMVVA